MPDNKYIENLYNTLVSDDYSTEDIGNNAQEFAQKLKDKNFSKSLYDTLISDEYSTEDIGDNADTFYGMHTPSSAVAPTSTNAPQTGANTQEVVSQEAPVAQNVQGNVAPAPQPAQPAKVGGNDSVYTMNTTELANDGEEQKAYDINSKDPVERMKAEAQQKTEDWNNWRGQSVKVTNEDGTTSELSQGEVYDKLWKVAEDVLNAPIGSKTIAYNIIESMKAMGYQDLFRMETDETGDHIVPKKNSMLNTLINNFSKKQAQSFAQNLVAQVEKLDPGHKNPDAINQAFFTLKNIDTIRNIYSKIGYDHATFMKDYVQPAIQTAMQVLYPREDLQTEIISLGGGYEAMKDEAVGREITANLQSFIADDIAQKVNDWENQREEAITERNKQRFLMRKGEGFMGRKAINEQYDPEKLLNSLIGDAEKIASGLIFKPEYVNFIMDKTAEYGYDLETLERLCAVNIATAIQREWEKSEIARELPKDQFEYVLRGITDDSIIGMIIQRMTMTETQQNLRNQANASGKYIKNGEEADVGIFAEIGRPVAGMTADFWLWGGWGNVGKEVAGKLLQERLLHIATTKGITVAEARVLLEAEAKNYLSKRVRERVLEHLPSSMVTFGGAQGSSAYVAARRDRKSIDEAVGEGIGTAVKSGIVGAPFGLTGGITEGLVNNLTGLPWLIGKAGQLAVETGTMFTTEEGEKIIQGKEAFENPLKDFARAFGTVLGFKASGYITSGKILNFNNTLKNIKAKIDYYRANPEPFYKGNGTPSLTKKDVEYINGVAEGKDFYDALTGVVAGGMESTRANHVKARIEQLENEIKKYPETSKSEEKKKLEEELKEAQDNLYEAEGLKELADKYDALSKSNSIPLATRQNLARFVGGIVEPKPEVGYRTEINEGTGEYKVYTVDEDGACVQVLDFKNGREYQEWKKGANEYFDNLNTVQKREGAPRGEEASVPLEIEGEGYKYYYFDKDGKKVYTNDKENMPKYYLDENRKPVYVDKVEDAPEGSVVYLEDVYDNESYNPAKNKAEAPSEPQPQAPETSEPQVKTPARERAEKVVSSGVEALQLAQDIETTSAMLDMMLEGDGYTLADARIAKKYIDESRTDEEIDLMFDRVRGSLDEETMQMLENYRQMMETSAEVDAVQAEQITQEVDALRKQLKDTAIQSEPNSSQTLLLNNGKEVYYRSGNLENEWGSIIVTDKEGNTYQIPRQNVKEVRAKLNIDDYVNAISNQLSQQADEANTARMNGANLQVGDKVNFEFSGTLMEGTIAGADDANIILRFDDGSQLPMPRVEFGQSLANARTIIAQQAVAGRKAEIKTQREEAEKKAKEERRVNGVVGYAEKSIDWDNPQNDAKVVAEILSESTAPREKIIAGMQAKRDGLFAKATEQKSRVERLRQFFEANKDTYSPEEEQEKLLKIQEAERLAEDYEARLRKWGEIRNEYMTPEEKEVLTTQRRGVTGKARDKAKGAVVKTEPNTAPTGKELLEKYETEIEADEALSEHLSATRKDIDKVHNELMDVQEQLRQYEEGITELTADEIKALTEREAQLDATEKTLLDEAISYQERRKKLSQTYKARTESQMDPHELALTKAEKATDYKTKLKHLKEAYKDDPEALAVFDNMEPQDIVEFVASTLALKSLDWESVKSEVFGDASGRIGKDSERSRVAGYIANEGGISVNQAAHEIWQQGPEINGEMIYGNIEIRDVIIRALLDMESSVDFRNTIINNRQAEAERIYQENIERERAEAEEAELVEQAKREAAEDALDEAARKIAEREERVERGKAYVGRSFEASDGTVEVTGVDSGGNLAIESEYDGMRRRVVMPVDEFEEHLRANELAGEMPFDMTAPMDDVPFSLENNPQKKGFVEQVFAEKSGRRASKADDKVGLVENEYSQMLDEASRGMLSDLGAKIGRKIEIRSDKAIRDEWHQDARGFYDAKTNTIVINGDKLLQKGPKELTWVLGHELTHAIKTANDIRVWDAFVELAKKAYEAEHGKGSYDKLFERTKKNYEENLGEKNDWYIEEEVCGNIAGDYIFRTREDIQRMIDSVQDGDTAVSLTKTILNYIKDLLESIKNMTGMGSFRTKLEDAKSVWEDMYRVAAARQREGVDSATRSRTQEEKPAFALVGEKPNTVPTFEDVKFAFDNEELLKKGKDKLESQDYAVPLQSRAYYSFINYDGNYVMGIEEYAKNLKRIANDKKVDEILATASEIKANKANRFSQRSAGYVGKKLTTSEALDVINMEISDLEAETAYRNNEKKRLANKYNVNANGDISFSGVTRLFHDLNSDTLNSKLFAKVSEALRSQQKQMRISEHIPTGARGAFNPISGLTQYSWDMIVRGENNNRKAKTILHELIHKATVYTLLKSKFHLPTLHPSERKAANEIRKIFDALVSDPRYKVLYANKNTRELIAELPNPDLRAALKTIEYDGRSAWQKVLDAFKEMIGITPSNYTKNAYKELSKAFDTLMDEFSGFRFNRDKAIMNVIAKRLKVDVSDNGAKPEITDLESLVDEVERRKGLVGEPKFALEKPEPYSEQEKADWDEYDKAERTLKYTPKNYNKYVENFEDARERMKNAYSNAIERADDEKTKAIYQKRYDEINNKPVPTPEEHAKVLSDAQETYDRIKPAFDARHKEWSDYYEEMRQEEIRKFDEQEAIRKKTKPTYAEFTPEQEADNKTIITKAKKEFGTTADMREAGYILTDGTMLDFSEKRDGGDRGRRSLDHRSIGRIEDGETQWDSVANFMHRGHIRIMPESGTITLGRKPTPVQMRKLGEFVRRNDGDVSIEFFDDNKQSEHYVEYEGAKAQRIAADINRYFDEGIRPEGNIKFALERGAIVDRPVEEDRDNATLKTGGTVYGGGYKNGKKIYPTGKIVSISGSDNVYIHKNYAKEVIPEDIFSKAESVLPEGFEYNTVMWKPKEPNIVRFDQSPDFDTAREPIPGWQVTVDAETGKILKKKFEKQIFHHKWQWVKPDYDGFDYWNSFDWSKEWLGRISNPFGFLNKWEQNLKDANLPEDKNQTRDYDETKNAVKFALSSELDEKYPNWMDNQVIEDENSKKGQSTQVAGTIGTYKKVGGWIQKNMPEGTTVLDASSGMGLGTKELRERGMSIEDIEPYPSGERMKTNPPLYSGVDAYEQLKATGKKYDFIISNAVLNVIPDDWRANVLHDMADLLADGGKIFINTRSKSEVKNIKNKIELDDPYEVLVGTPDKIISYQKFFDVPELKAWIESELGDGYTVERANEKNSGTKGLSAVVVTKEPKFALDEKSFDDELSDMRSSFDDGVRFAIGGKRKTEMLETLNKRRTDMSEDMRQTQLDAIEKLGEDTKEGGNAKLEKIATYWVANGNLTFHGIDDQSARSNVTRALAICEAKHIDPFNYKNPLELLQKYEDWEPKQGRIDPATVKEFTYQKSVGDIDIYTVEDNENGQIAVRKVIDSHFGYNANPWCLAAREPGTGGFYNSALSFWKNTYNGVPKRIAFKNGKLIAFNAQEPKNGKVDVEDREYLESTAEFQNLVEGFTQYDETESGEGYPNARLTIDAIADEYGEIAYDALEPDYWNETIQVKYPEDFVEMMGMEKMYDDLTEDEMTWWDREDEAHNGLLISEKRDDGKVLTKYVDADGNDTYGEDQSLIYEDKKRGLKIEYDVDDESISEAWWKDKNGDDRLHLTKYYGSTCIVSHDNGRDTTWTVDDDGNVAERMQWGHDSIMWYNDGRVRAYTETVDGESHEYLKGNREEKYPSIYITRSFPHEVDASFDPTTGELLRIKAYRRKDNGNVPVYFSHGVINAGDFKLLYIEGASKEDIERGVNAITRGGFYEKPSAISKKEAYDILKRNEVEDDLRDIIDGKNPLMDRWNQMMKEDPNFDSKKKHPSLDPETWDKGGDEPKFALEEDNRDPMEKMLDEVERRDKIAGDIESKNFKKWFGDWEKEPEKASKVVDEDGKPLVVYHGTKNYGFTIFDTVDPRGTGDTANIGTHFGNADTAEEFNVGKNGGVYDVYLNIRKPWEAPFDFFADNYDNAYLDAVTDLAHEVGDDAVKVLKEKLPEIYPDADKGALERAIDGEDFLTLFSDDEGLFADSNMLGASVGNKARPKVVELIKDIMKMGGYDGIKYENWYEGEANNECWVALEPTQIKSATDNNGNYDGSNPDIRFALDGGSYFSGGGTVERALDGVMNNMFGVEFDRNIAAVYEDNLGGHIINADVRDKKVGEEINKVLDGKRLEYFHASPVCKNFSKANRDGQESHIDIETAQATADLIRERRPRVVTIENVASYQNSDAVKLITKALDDAGYFWDKQVYNAKDYGSPMVRERMIIRASTDQMLQPVPKGKKQGWYEVVEDLIPKLYPTRLAEWQRKRLKEQGINFEHPKEPLIVYGGATGKGKTLHAYGSEPAPSMNANAVGTRIIMPDGRVLMANPRIFARLMGLPDSYKLPRREDLAYKVVGNGVPAALTEAVIRPLVEAHDKKEEPRVLFALDEVEKKDPFYSNAAKAVADIRQEKATPEQWLKMIEKSGGLKKGEDKWLGLSDWLKERTKDGSKTLTKDEVMKYIAENSIKLEEVEYGNNTKLPEWLSEMWYDALDRNNQSVSAAWREILEDDPTIEEDYYVDDEGELVSIYGNNSINSTRLMYTTRGLGNKREIAMVVPTIEPWQANDYIHFGDAGNGRTIGWLRFGDTTSRRELTEDERTEASGWVPTADKWVKVDGSQFVNKHDLYYLPKDLWNDNPFGTTYIADYSKNGYWLLVIGGTERRFNTLEEAVEGFKNKVADFASKIGGKQKVLVIDEIQSNRHQEGRKQGYKSEYADSPKGRFEAAVNAMREFRDKMNEKYGMFHFVDDYTEAERAEYEKLQSTEYEASKYDDSKQKLYNIPDAPFEKNWAELLMKRALRYAAEHGYDKVAWTTGAQQAERYDLGHTVDKITVYKYPENNYHELELNVKNGIEPIKMNVTPDGSIINTNARYNTLIDKNLSEVVGKELAEKILGVSEYKVFKEGELSIGGEGMKAFYDQMLPKFMDKYGKKWGVRTQDVELDGVGEADRVMHSVDVNDAMRESVMQGQPLFALADAQTTDQANREAWEKAKYGYTNPDAVILMKDGSEMVTFGADARKVAKELGKEMEDGKLRITTGDYLRLKNDKRDDSFDIKIEHFSDWEDWQTGKDNDAWKSGKFTQKNVHQSLKGHPELERERALIKEAKTVQERDEAIDDYVQTLTDMLDGNREDIAVLKGARPAILEAISEANEMRGSEGKVKFGVDSVGKPQNTKKSNSATRSRTQGKKENKWRKSAPSDEEIAQRLWKVPGESTFSAGEYYEGDTQALAKAIKAGDESAIKEAARRMALWIELFPDSDGDVLPMDEQSKQQYREATVLVPVPSHTGKATYTKRLAEEISKLTGIPVVDCLTSEPYESSYEKKGKGEKAEIPEFIFSDDYDKQVAVKGKQVLLIDNVMASGNTMNKAVDAVEEIATDSYIYRFPFAEDRSKVLQIGKNDVLLSGDEAEARRRKYNIPKHPYYYYDQWEKMMKAGDDADDYEFETDNYDGGIVIEGEGMVSFYPGDGKLGFSEDADELKALYENPWRDIDKAVVHTRSISKLLPQLHERAKAGDVLSASYVIDELIEAKKIDTQKVAMMAAKYPEAVVVYPHANSEIGRNALSAAYAQLFEKYGMELDKGIVQTNRVYRTGADRFGRLIRRARFAGDVEPGREYVIVDDHITSGATVRDLKDYIESKGGKVVAVSAIEGSMYGQTLRLSEKTKNELIKNGVTDEQLQELGISRSVQNLTEQEGRELLKLSQRGRDFRTKAQQRSSAKRVKAGVSAVKQDEQGGEARSDNEERSRIEAEKQRFAELFGLKTEDDSATRSRTQEEEDSAGKQLNTMKPNTAQQGQQEDEDSAGKQLNTMKPNTAPVEGELAFDENAPREDNSATRRRTQRSTEGTLQFDETPEEGKLPFKAQVIKQQKPVTYEELGIPFDESAEDPVGKAMEEAPGAIALKMLEGEESYETSMRIKLMPDQWEWLSKRLGVSDERRITGMEISPETAQRLAKVEYYPENYEELTQEEKDEQVKKARENFDNADKLYEQAKKGEKVINSENVASVLYKVMGVHIPKSELKTDEYGLYTKESAEENFYGTSGSLRKHGKGGALRVLGYTLKNLLKGADDAYSYDLIKQRLDDVDYALKYYEDASRGERVEDREMPRFAFEDEPNTAPEGAGNEGDMMDSILNAAEARRDGRKPELSRGDQRRKPRKKKNETMAQFTDRLREWNMWNRAEQESRDNNDPMPKKEAIDQKWEDRYQKDYRDWCVANGLDPDGDNKIGKAPVRQNGESPQDFAKRVIAYEERKDMDKTAPNPFDYYAKADAEYRKEYEDWKKRYNIKEKEDILSILTGKDPNTAPEGERSEAEVDAELEAMVDRDMDEPEVSAVGNKVARNNTRMAVIERRKNLESRNAADAVYLHDLAKMCDEVAKNLSEKTGQKITGKMLREALPDIIEDMYGVEIQVGEDGTPIFIEHDMPIDAKDPEVQALVSNIKSWYDEFYQTMDEVGLRGDAGYVEQYVNHIWDKDRSDPKAWEEFVENRQRTTSGNMKERIFMTYEEGRSVGLVPKYNDILQIMGEYSKKNNEAIANRQMLTDLSLVQVAKKNADGEIVGVKPLLTSKQPSSFDEQDYDVIQNVPGVGTVWVHKAAAKPFKAIFEQNVVPTWLHAIDNMASLAKKIELSLSGFHMGALSEVLMVQNMVSFGPIKGGKAFFKVTNPFAFWDTVIRGKDIAMRDPELFKDAAKHLVKLGATSDYAAEDVRAMTARFRQTMEQWYKEGNIAQKGAGAATYPIATMMDWINKGFDRALWNWLHDGYKLESYRLFSDTIRYKAEKEGWSEEELDRQLDEAGQYINDMFGGQHWDVLGISPKSLRWARRLLLSPDWFVSTSRHALAMTGAGSIYGEPAYKQFAKWAKEKTGKSTEGEKVEAPEGAQRGANLRTKNAWACYGIGVMVFTNLIMNGINAYMRKWDEEEEKKRAEQGRKTNPNYKSRYELAYPNGMTWKDYTMFGNAPGHKTHLFMGPKTENNWLWNFLGGRYADDKEMYVRWGKQFREVPEFFMNEKGDFEIGAPIINRMIGKSNPLIGLGIDEVQMAKNPSYQDKELIKKYGRPFAMMYRALQKYMPFGFSGTYSGKEYKGADFIFPSSKGFSDYKAQEYFKDAFREGDWELFDMTYRACQMNGIDAEKQIKAAQSAVEALLKENAFADVTDTQTAMQKFDSVDNLKDKRKTKKLIEGFLAPDEFSQFTLEQAREKLDNYLNGTPEEVNKTADKYLMTETAQDVVEDWRLAQQRKELQKVKDVADQLEDDEKYNYERSHYEELKELKKLNSTVKKMGALKSRLGDKDYDDEETMSEIRELRKKAVDGE